MSMHVRSLLAAALAALALLSTRAAAQSPLENAARAAKEKAAAAKTRPSEGAALPGTTKANCGTRSAAPCDAGESVMAGYQRLSCDVGLELVRSTTGDLRCADATVIGVVTGMVSPGRSASQSAAAAAAANAAAAQAGQPASGASSRASSPQDGTTAARADRSTGGAMQASADRAASGADASAMGRAASGADASAMGRAASGADASMMGRAQAPAGKEAAGTGQAATKASSKASSKAESAAAAANASAAAYVPQDLGKRDPMGFPRVEGLRRTKSNGNPVGEIQDDVAEYESFRTPEEIIADYLVLAKQTYWKWSSGDPDGSGTGASRLIMLGYTRDEQSADLRVYGTDDGGARIYLRVSGPAVQNKQK